MVKDHSYFFFLLSTKITSAIRFKFGAKKAIFQHRSPHPISQTHTLNNTLSVAAKSRYENGELLSSKIILKSRINKLLCDELENLLITVNYNVNDILRFFVISQQHSFGKIGICWEV